MARIGIHGKVQSASRYLDAIPILEWILDDIENTINGQIDSTNLQNSAVTSAKLAPNAVTSTSIASGAVTSAAIDSTVSRIVTQQYTGDGTQNREINIGFRARSVMILRHDNTTRFQAWGNTTTPFARVQISATGAAADGGTDFTGTSLNGFTLGSAIGGGASNAAGVTYSFVAL